MEGTRSYGAALGQSSSAQAVDADSLADACAVPADSRPRRRVARAMSAAAFASLALGCVAATLMARQAGSDARPQAELARMREAAASYDSPLERAEAEIAQATAEATAQATARAEEAGDTTAPKPHIILMTIDDLGYNDIGYSSTDIAGATPFLTSLAHAGVRLTSYYGQEMCTPARATLMTGRWAPSIGFQDTQLTERSTHGVPLWAKLLPQHLKDHGYATYGIGKWNIGFCNESYLPWNRGFDWFLGYMTQGVTYYQHQASTYSYQDTSNRTHHARNHSGPSKAQLAMRKRKNSGNATSTTDDSADATADASAADASGEAHVGDEAQAAEQAAPQPRALRTSDSEGNHTMATGLETDGTTTNDDSSTRPLYDMLEGVAESGKWKTGKAYQGNYTTHLFGEKAIERIRTHFKLTRDRNETEEHAAAGGAAPAQEFSAGIAAEGDFAASGGNTAQQPLFMWVAFHAVHRDDDSEPPGHLLTLDQFNYLHVTLPESGIATNRARLAEALMPVDVAARRIIEKLEHAGALDNSLIVVHSDNGGDTCHAIGDVAPWGSNWPLRGRKMSYFEGGIRVPAFVYSPSLIPKWRVGGTYAGMMHHVDWLATFVRLAGGSPETLRAQGYASRDHWDAITAGPRYNGTVRDEIVYDLPQNASFVFSEGTGGGKAQLNLADWHGVVALRVGDFKLLYTAGNETWFPAEMRSDTCPYYAFSDTCATNLASLDTDCEWGNFLFDVANDPYERHNLFHHEEHSERRVRLEQRAKELLDEYSGAFDKSVAFGTNAQTWSAAREAFYDAGDYVVPWGCAAV